MFAADITDVAHPVVISDLKTSTEWPYLVSPTEVSWLWNDSGRGTRVYRTNFITHKDTLVATCAVLYGWSPDSTTMMYVAPGYPPLGYQLRRLSGGKNELIGATEIPSTSCGGEACDDDFEWKMVYSPDGRYIAIAAGGAQEPSLLRVLSATGATLFQDDEHLPTMTVWSGDNLYFRDQRGIEVWRGGASTLVAAGVSWVTPNASPTGDRIAFAVRDSTGLPHVKVLDVASGSIHELAAGGKQPMFLGQRYVFYVGACGRLGCGPYSGDDASGNNYIYDLQTGSTQPTAISFVASVWPQAN